jgi:hypothetical protein
MEAITDPDTETGWYDSSLYENGDECAYVFGPTKGRPGQLYNQVINHHTYLTRKSSATTTSPRPASAACRASNPSRVIDS